MGMILTKDKLILILILLYTGTMADSPRGSGLSKDDGEGEHSSQATSNCLLAHGVHIVDFILSHFFQLQLCTTTF